ncbi:MAG: hypothetical protein ACFFE5_09830 [Candidatus Thorarchaeota archaeon]
MSYKWDYLIILDACRYDMFKWVLKDESIPFVVSGGSGTKEWMEWNFKGNFKDVVYISGNPFLSNIYLEKFFGRIPFFKLIDVWDYGWNDSVKTVLPHTVTDAALKALTTYHNKRLIIHYNQPHHPFLSDEVLLKMDSGPQRIGVPMKGKTIWHAIKLGEIPLKTVWKAYIKNLQIVLKEVNRLVENLSGKIVITSDHGNQMGKFFQFGHLSYGIRTEELCKVPWYTIIKKGKELLNKEQFNEEKIIIKSKIDNLLKNGDF